MGVSNQRWKIVEVRCSVPLLNEARELKPDIDKLASYVYEEFEEHALKKVNIRPLVIYTPPEIVGHDVGFDEIQDTVIQGIRDAKYMIWFAVTWFSSDAIYNELIAKKNRGVSIRVLVSNEPTNNITVQNLKREGVDVKVVNIWAKNANDNEETLVTALDCEFVSNFADIFMEIYNENV